MVRLSIILPTCNRADLLRRAIESIHDGTSLAYELIVVDGASTDHTPQVLAEASAAMGSGLRVIREAQREGFVRAANRGFREARGRFFTWLNDDARIVPGALDMAAAQLENSPPDVGLLALFHRVNTTRNIAYETIRMGVPFRLLHVRGTLYANFGLGRRATFENLGFFDERYRFNAADPDFSLKVWDAGLRVVPACGSLIDHAEHADERRAADGANALADNEKLFAKWDLPPRNPTVNDFDPARPCTLRGLRRAALAA